jgi:phosphoribosylformylglycinamidine synthase
MSVVPVTLETARAHGLADDEYRRICAALGRTPNLTELGMFAVMWSEHCSYKSSRVHLRKLPTQAPWVLQGPGENAGIVDLGDGFAACFKMESHNHPSFVEPVQGAATGVGGILRDIFTMGARPIASLNSLRFGDIHHPRTRYLVEGVVAGIGWYGNCFGCPTVGGEVQFHASYNGNVLVNAFNLGLVPADHIFRGVAAGVGNPVMYVGSRTGRDGIHGASLLASAEFDQMSEEKRPTVQVGDPFTERLLLEACLEAMATGAVVGIQDMGAAGLTCSSAEMAGRGGLGVEIDLDRVPRREERMSAYELMLSESQERMLIVAAAGREAEIEAVFRKWDLDVAVVGRVTADGLVTVRSGGEVVASIPARALTEEAPVYHRPMTRPGWQDQVQSLDLDGVKVPDDLSAVLVELMLSENHASREWVFHQYDHTIGSNTAAGPGGDAAVVRIKGTDKAVAMSVDCNSRYVFLDPRQGARLAVAEATRNVSASGARPLAITDCLNFGNPERPEIMWQFAEAVEGIAEACRALDVPVVSGNVSFYNETAGKAICPTPTIGAIGLLERPHKLRPAQFRRPGDVVVLVGTSRLDLGGSEYLARIHQMERGLPPALDLDFEKRVQRVVREALRSEFCASVHDVADGGLAVALAECCLGVKPLGAHIRLASDLRLDALLFGETPSRYVLSLGAECLDGLEGIAGEEGVPVAEIGEVLGSDLVIEVNGNVVVRTGIVELKTRWRTALFERLGAQSS